MIRGNSWTPAEEAWLREVYPHHFNDEVAAMHAEAFPDRPRRTHKAVNSRAKVLGLRKADGFDRAARAKEKRRTTWPPERVEWLRGFAPGHDIYEIIDEFERLYGIKLSKYAMKNAKQRYGAKSGTNVGQFQKGQEPPNKGKSWDEMGVSERARANIRRTQFKRGDVPQNGAAIPLGSERVDPDGYVYVKTSMLSSRPCKNDCWTLKHRVVYEQHNGPIPDGYMVVFADHDNRNFDPVNLVAVPRDLWAVINKRSIAYWDADSLRTAMLIAKVDRARYAAQKRPRKCRKCGEEFEARFPNQRTCDSCLGR